MRPAIFVRNYVPASNNYRIWIYPIPSILVLLKLRDNLVQIGLGPHLANGSSDYPVSISI